MPSATLRALIRPKAAAAVEAVQPRSRVYAVQWVGKIAVVKPQTQTPRKLPEGPRAAGLRQECVSSGPWIAPARSALHAGPIPDELRPEGKQYIVVAPGGHVGLGTPLGDVVMADTLPE
jgi:hypothetical protein